MIYDAFLENRSYDSMFWNDSIFDIGRNHIPGNTEFGDSLRFTPGGYGHLARKIGFYVNSNTGEFVVSPDILHGRDDLSYVQREILEIAWNLALDVQQSAATEMINPNDYAVKIELLKYPDSAENLQQLFDLLADAAGSWTKLGQKLDRNVATASKHFNRRYLRHVYALMSLVPGVGRRVQYLNRKLSDSPYNFIPVGKTLVGPPHTDGSRYLTLLAGNRLVISTEIFDNGRWIEIPVAQNSLSILPTNLYEKRYGLPATVHRYLIARSDPKATADNLNVTLLIGVIPRTDVSQQRGSLCS